MTIDISYDNMTYYNVHVSVDHFFPKFWPKLDFGTRDIQCQTAAEWLEIVQRSFEWYNR